ncbi:MAG: alpha/beta hydrolase, partial [Acidimicrobiia bacterium]|nr:alpha/beta hydrolase [Acidimicrobiia bacterium]
ADRYRCTTLDWRGVGESAVGDQPFSRRDDLTAVLDAVGAATATLIGCSIGAGFSLDFAIERPERVDKLVLVGVTPNGFDGEDDPLFEHLGPQIDAAIEAGDFEKAGQMEARLWVDGPRRGENSAPKWLLDKVVEWTIPINKVTDWGESLQIDPPAFLRLGEVQAPTLVIVGTEDSMFVIDACRATADGIPSAELVEVAGTAHLPNLEVPEVFNSALGGFLST